ncbi:MAG: P-type DNA transfer ATPase VirB11 [Proteobacteria bacterium]|nr:P-type DNA transfer ATPase VirB11 [Pseudomonadota bacterium]
MVRPEHANQRGHSHCLPHRIRVRGSVRQDSHERNPKKVRLGAKPVSATLDHLLTPLRPFWDERGVEEICINKPGEAWIWTKGRFERRNVDLDADDIEDLAHVAAAQWRRDVTAQSPLLSCDLPGNGRLQVVLSPCVAPGHPSITIRIGDEAWPTLDQYITSGFFNKTRNVKRSRPEVDDQLAELYRAGDWGAFFRLAVRAKKTIIGCGETASGKTRFSKALLGEVPHSERLITIEDAPELRGLPHPNRVMMFYNKEAKGTGDGLGPTARQLIEAALRMRIGRLFLQEIRDDQAVTAFLAALLSGHPGAITTLHARSPAEVFDRLQDLVSQDIVRNLQANIDVICHFDRWGNDFSMSEVWFKPVSTGGIQ